MLNLCSGMEAMLEGILRTGFKVTAYHHCDTDSVAAQVMIRRLGGLKMPSPSQLGTSAVTRAFGKMSGDTTGIRQSHLKEIVQQMVTTHSLFLAGGGLTCQELSAAGGLPRGLAGHRSGRFYPTIELIPRLQQIANQKKQRCTHHGYMLRI